MREDFKRTFRFLSVTARVNTYSMKRGCWGRRRGSNRGSPGEKEREKKKQILEKE